MYLDVIRDVYLLHRAVQGNNFFLRLFGWKQLVLLAFALNKTNYARYGSYHINSLENMDSAHPGCSEIIAVKGLSVQGQDEYPCRTAVDERGEQTINRDAKTSGGIKYFASDPRSILKWTLNRSTQARNTQALYDLADSNYSEDKRLQSSSSFTCS